MGNLCEVITFQWAVPLSKNAAHNRVNVKGLLCVCVKSEKVMLPFISQDPFLAECYKGPVKCQDIESREADFW